MVDICEQVSESLPALLQSELGANRSYPVPGLRTIDLRLCLQAVCTEEMIIIIRAHIACVPGFVLRHVHFAAELPYIGFCPVFQRIDMPEAAHLKDRAYKRNAPVRRVNVVTSVADEYSVEVHLRRWM